MLKQPDGDLIAPFALIFTDALTEMSVSHHKHDATTTKFSV